MNFWEWCIAHGTELIVAAVAVVVLIIVICISVAVHKRKKKSAVGKIYKTTEGFLSNKNRRIKDRRVASIEQRKCDGAVVVVRIYSEDGKEEKIGELFIPDLVLTPEEHSSLTKNSIIGRKAVFGIKIGENKFKPLYESDFVPTGDKLSDEELRKAKEGVHNNNPRYRKTYKNKLRKWRRGFKDK